MACGCVTAGSPETDPRESIDPGRLTTRVGISRVARRALGRPAPRGWDLVGAASHRPEAIRAIDGLAAGRAERNLGFLAAVRAGRGEHLPRPTIAIPTTIGAVAAAAAAAAAVATTGGIPAAGAVAAVAAGPGAGTGAAVPSSLAAGPARRASARLGEPALGVEVLLTRGEHELLPAIRAGQGLVAVHETKTPLGSRAIPSGFLASAVRGVRVIVELLCVLATDASVALPRGSLDDPRRSCTGVFSLRTADPAAVVPARSDTRPAAPPQSAAAQPRARSTPRRQARYDA